MVNPTGIGYLIGPAVLLVDGTILLELVVPDELELGSHGASDAGLGGCLLADGDELTLGACLDRDLTLTGLVVDVLGDGDSEGC